VRQRVDQLVGLDRPRVAVAPEELDRAGGVALLAS
jgi:hypothetical protein